MQRHSRIIRSHIHGLIINLERHILLLQLCIIFDDDYNAPVIVVLQIRKNLKLCIGTHIQIWIDQQWKHNRTPLWFIHYKEINSKKTCSTIQCDTSAWLSRNSKFLFFCFGTPTQPIRVIAMSDQGITTYSVEYREKPGAKCATCSKSILAKSLAASEIFRKSKTEKKKLAKHTWYHFKCWTGKEPS